MTGSAARRFWDARAREHALHFVDNRVSYGAPDAGRFWSDGERDALQLLDAAGVELHGDEDVVEIGCGVGRLTRVLAARAASVRALDVSSEMLRLAREHNPHLGNVTWLLGDGTTLAGIEDASADACLSHVVFQHIPDPAVTLGYVREMGRVLRPGGWAAFHVSQDPAVHRRRPTALAAVARSLVRRGPRGTADAHWLGSAVTSDEVAAAAADGGMEVELEAGAGTQYCVVRARRR